MLTRPAQHEVSEPQDFTSRYTVTKTSWKGRFTRIFAIGKTSIATLNPQTLFKETNRFMYGRTLRDVQPDGSSDCHFTVSVLNQHGKSESMNFCCRTPEERFALLSDLQANRHLFDEVWSRSNTSSSNMFQAKKLSWDNSSRHCFLRVTPCGVDQVVGDQVVGRYLFMHLNAIADVSSDAHKIILQYGPDGRLHLFDVNSRVEFIEYVRRCAQRYIGLIAGQHFLRASDPLSVTEFSERRYGIRLDQLAPLMEFAVSKLSRKHTNESAVARIVSTTESGFLVERDPSTYAITSVYPLRQVETIVRSDEDEQRMHLVIRSPHKVRCYTLPLRDVFMAHLVEGCREAGNLSACIVSRAIDHGKRVGPCEVPVTEEVEGLLLRCLVDPSVSGKPPPVTAEVVEEFFNANVDHLGLRYAENKGRMFSENREKLVFQALSAVLNRRPTAEDVFSVEQHLRVLRRLVLSRVAYSSIALLPDLARSAALFAVEAMNHQHTATTFAALDFLNAIMAPHHDQYELKHEYINKNRILHAEAFVRSLLVMLRDIMREEASSLVVQSILQLLVYAICPPYSSTTDEEVFSRVLHDLMEIVGKQLFHLLSHACDSIRYLAGQLLRVLLEEGTEDQFKQLQRSALRDGSFLLEFNAAMYSTNRLHRDLARRLIAYWAYKNTKLQDILRRMVPVTLLSFLQEKGSAPVEEQLMEMEKPVKAMDDGFLECKKGWFKPYFHPSQLLPPSEQPVAPPSSPEASTPASVDGKEPTPPATPAVKLRERRLRVQPTLNWEMFFTQIKQDHMRPDLIWTATTREELRQSIDQELQRFASGAEFSASDSELPVTWNCEEFEVSYPSLKDELQVGQHYPRLLFECKNPVIARPQEFFNDLYHRFLLVSDTRTRLECLHGMAVLYQHYGEKIGQFNDLSYLLAMLKDTTDPMFRDRMLLFLRYALTVRSNAKQLLDCRGVETLAESVTLAQLHIDRPTLPMQSSAIEYAGNLEDIQAKENEWHYYKDGQRASPVSYTELKSMYQKGAITDRSKVWAQGMSGWRELREVPQLRWGICAAGHPAILSLTEVTCTILDIFMVLCQHYPTRDEDGAVMQPIPRVKLLLGSPSVIPHIVQLLLTFDPCVCTRVHRLLLHVMTDNQRLNRLYLSGYFFFSLMYAASDVLPMCEVFYMAHHRQAFRLSESPQEAVRTSVLAPLLPPAMICYLSNHGPEKFAELLLSDMETPEAIWNKEMRRLLASKLACHVADFTPRLLANNTIMYQYCPIVPVTYEVLQQELFCSGYYLRHLCDTVKYPEWPIRDPSHFLRDVMAVWRERQAGRKDAPMTRERALEDLGFEAAEAAHEVPLPTIRKAYYQRAAQFHPDKNPNGRETFERVQAAYEFLAAQHSSKVEVSDAHDMRLILKSQCILFQRCGHELQRYKYPGYALLFSALAKEMQDVNIVENGLELTTLLVELSYQSVSNVPLNADELQEEGVIALLSTLLQRCFHHVTMTSTDADQTSRAAYFCMKTLAVCGGLDECRTRMAYEPEVTYLTAKGIACKQAPDLCSACVEACTAEAESQLLQYRLISAGAVWHLLQLLFRYDPTVEDSGISMDASLHRQCQDNRMAVLAVGALCALAGFHPEGSGRSTHRQAEVVEQLRVLLSPYIGHLMECKPACEREVLRLLNGNSESPCFLWNNSTRAELLDIVGRNARAAWASPDPQTRPSSGDELEAFQYALHDGELMVGGIYLRLYVSQPQFVVEKPDAFYHALITFVEAQLTLFDPNPVKVEGHLQLALQAMENIVAAAPDSMERQTTPADSLLVLLRAIALNHAPAITIQAAKHLEHLSGISSSLASLGEVEHAMKFVARALNQYRSSDHHSIAVQEALLHFLQVALMNRSIVQQTMDSGLYVVLLYLMATTEVPSICIACCTCIAKASADRLVGPRIVRYTINLLPSVLLDTLLEHPQQAYQLLRNTQMNPELCWNEGKRNQLLADLATCRTSQERWAAGTSSEAWEMPELSHDEALDEYQVANVYVEMFVKHPGWSVRRPKQFLAALCDAFLQLAEKEQDGPTPATEHRLQLVTAAHVHLLRTTPGLRDYMVSLGYVTKVVGMLGSSNPVVAKATLEWVHEMAESPACIKAMAVADPVGRLLHLWSREPSLTVDALTALERLFTHSSRTNLLQYALHHQIPQVLLNLLDTGVAENHTTVPPAAFRALLIKVIKAMLVIEDPVYGPVVSGILSQSATWKKYQHHSHDLFLRDAAAAPRTVDTLYLTAAMADGVSDGTRDPRIPPPL